MKSQVCTWRSIWIRVLCLWQVVAAIYPLTLQGALALALCAVTMLCDGICIGSNDFGHLPRTNFVAMLACSATLVLTHQVDRPRVHAM
jgi:hypothetical protein